MDRQSIIYDNPDLLLLSDVHSRISRPICRTDDYKIAQHNKMQFIADIANKYSCPLIIAGDVGNKSEWNNSLLSYWILWSQLVNNEIYLIPGQHDLPNHELKQWIKSGLKVLDVSNSANILINNSKAIKVNGKWINIVPCPYGTKIPKQKFPMEKNFYRTILVIHKMIIKDKPLWPGQLARTGKYFLKHYPIYDIIISGDNHQPFVEQYHNRILVNCGSIMRMTADQKNHKPRVYLYYVDKNIVIPVFLPIEKGVINKEYITRKKKQEKRLKIYAKHIKKQYEIGIVFKKNILEHLDSNKIKKGIRKVVLRNIKE